MKIAGYFFAGLLLASAFIACADVSSRLRRYTYPPDFNYIAEEQLRSTMWQLARDVRELDRTVRAPAPIEEPRRSEILKLLVSMEHATERLGQEGRRSNHPVIDEHLATLRRDIALARKQVENEPPNYVLVGLLPGACLYCHSGGR
jgi:hypothetical protein